jgi:hypothetical protein
VVEGGEGLLVRRMLTSNVSFVHSVAGVVYPVQNSLRKSALHPRSRKTPRGGKKIARTILMISLQAEECKRGTCAVWCHQATLATEGSALTERHLV